MATPFSHTVRSIKFDNYYFSLAGLLTAIILAIIWGNWFLTAQITYYEDSQKIYVTDKENLLRQFPQTSDAGIREQIIRQRVIVAEFPPNSVKNIKQGQIAYIQLDGQIGQQTGSIIATVEDMQSIKGREIIILQANIDSTAPNPFEKGGGGKVKIEVGHITPVAMILNASGLLSKTAPLSSGSR